MLLPIVASFVVILALSISYPSANRFWLQRFIAISPFLLLALLLIPWPLTDTFSIVWKPISIFPDPILFRTTPLAISFSVSLCVVWLLMEASQLFSVKSSISSRIFSLFFLGAGIICFFASNATATLFSWILLDVLTFFLLLFVDISSANQPLESTNLLSKSFGLFSLNLFSNILILYPALAGPQSTQLEWTSVWSNPPTPLALFCFFCGIFLRLFLFPVLVASSRFRTPHPNIDFFLRLLYPTTVLALLSHAWPGGFVQSASLPIHIILFWSSAVILLLSSWQSVLSSSTRTIRDLFPIEIAALSVAASLQTPQSSLIFQGTASLLLIGGGVIWLFSSSVDQPVLSWIQLFPVMLCISGFIFTPGEPLLSSWSSLLRDGNWFYWIPVFVGIISLLAALIRLSLRANDSALVSILSRWYAVLCMLLASVFLLYPGYHAAQNTSWLYIVLPLLFLLLGFLLFYFVQNFLLIRIPSLRHFEESFSLSWIPVFISGIVNMLRNLFQIIEQAFNGEGAFLWAFGIILLVWIAFRIT